MPDLNAVARLQDAVRARIFALTVRNDRAAVTDDLALAEAEQLIEAAQEAPGNAFIEAVHAVAWLRWYRYQVLPAGADRAELRAALTMFGQLVDVHPGLVPDELRPLFDSDQAPSGGPDDWVDRVALLIELAGVLDDSALFDRAVGLARQTVAGTAPDHPDFAFRLTTLSGALWSRYQREAGDADLNEAVAVGRQALLAASGSAELGRYLSNLGMTLQDRYMRFAQRRDLDEALDLLRSAVRETPAGHPDRAMYLSNLANALHSQLMRGGTRTDIDEAIDFARQSVNSTAPGQENRSVHLSNLGTALRLRFEQFGGQADLDESVEVTTEAIQTLPPGHPRMAGCLLSFGISLYTRYRVAGAPADLDRAVLALRSGLQEAPVNHPNRGLFVAAFVNALRRQLERVGVSADLDGAVDLVRQAVAMTPSDHPILGLVMSSLTDLLRVRYQRTGALLDLDEAIEVGRAAVRSTPTDDPNRGRFLSNLGVCLHARYHHAEASGGHGRRAALVDLDEAVRVSREAVNALPFDNPARAASLSNLGDALQSRFDVYESLSDLDESIAFGRAAVAATPAGRPHRATYLLSLGNAAHSKFGRTGRRADIDEAIDCWRKAAETAAAPVPTRMVAARSWAEAAADLGDRWADAVAGFAAAVDLLPLLVWRGQHRPDSEHLLAQVGGLGSGAAACAIAAGQVERAVELLEQARAVLWSQLLDTRTDLAALRQVSPDLADELDEVAAELNSPAPADAEDDEQGQLAAAQRVDHRLFAARRWDDAVARVRQLPGFSDYLRPVPARRLCQAADGGPVVLINLSRWRCDALAVTTAGVRLIPLPDLRHDDAIEHAGRSLTAVLAVQRAAPRGLGLPAADPSKDTDADLTPLGWLWDVAAAPILTTLGFTADPAAPEPLPRLWWCPTGPLALMPIHAAGSDRSEPGDGASVLDRVVSSYTPTLRILAEARARNCVRTVESPGRDLLMVAMPHTPGQVPLRHVTRECDAVLAAVGTRRCTVLRDAEATVRAVAAALVQHPFAHFSCHGSQDLTNPSAGGLHLHDGTLSLTDAALLHSRQGELAFLSACQTATSGLVNLDEVINLATALHYAGWRHVIGTLWSVYDASAARLTSLTYEYMTRDGAVEPAAAARALHNAVHRMRAEGATHPSLWAAFIHLGP